MQPETHPVPNLDCLADLLNSVIECLDDFNLHISCLTGFRVLFLDPRYPNGVSQRGMDDAQALLFRGVCFYFLRVGFLEVLQRCFRLVGILGVLRPLLCLSLKRAWIFNIHPPNHTVYRVTISVGTGQGRTVQRSPAMFFDLYLSR